MAKPEWGMKRVCPSCGSRYYDMRHDPVLCPKCGTVFDVEAVVKTKRVRAQAMAETAIGPIAAEELDTELVAGMEGEVGDTMPVEPATEAVVDEDAEEEADEAETETEEEEVIEDASELGEDEDDMAEVIENVDEEEER